MKIRTYETLQAWMEATGTNRRTLARLAKIDETALSRILSRSRQCSVDKALRLHEATGKAVPVENLIRWFVGDGESRLERAVKARGSKCA